MGIFKAAQRQSERSHIPTTYPSMQSGRQSALLSTSASRPAPADWRAQFEHATRFGHSLNRISILPPGDSPRGAIHQAVQVGVQTPASRLPYAGQIQQAFGHHDVGQLKAHLGPEAAQSATAIQALAYATGDHVVFAGRPDLYTVAHEATHVMQQRAGARPVNGIGHVGDVYERHADAVAERVVAGQPAQDLLDRLAPGRHEMAGTTPLSRNTLLALQHQPVVQRMVPGTGTSGTIVPSTTLRAVETKNDNGAAGSFEYRKRWEVDHPVAGIIVQHVTREFHVYQVGSTHEMTGAEIDSYIGGGSSNAYGTVLEYWELWTVDASGKVGPVDEDTFGLCAIKPKKTRGYRDTTTGAFTITGVTNFYPNTTAPDLLGFALGGVETAGGLYSTTSDPTSKLGAPTGPTISHEVKVVWDTETTNPVSKPGPYPERPKWKAGTADSQVTSTYS